MSPHPITIEVPSGRLGYREVVNKVVECGRRRAPRGIKTFDLGWVTVVLQSPFDALPLGVGRNLNTAIAAAEAVQLIGAFSDPDLLLRASPNFERFREPDGSFHGAYGRRMEYQLLHVVNRLREDPDTRRAVINLWDGHLDNAPGKNDYPCTVALGFGIVDDHLEMYTVMRSNDVWLGAPYDWFQFTQLQLTVARMLGVEPGPYHHTAWSLHLYESDLEKVGRLTEAGEFPDDVDAIGFGTLNVDPLKTMSRLRRLPYEALEVMTPTERWYREQLRDRAR